MLTEHSKFFHPVLQANVLFTLYLLSTNISYNIMFMVLKGRRFMNVFKNNEQKTTLFLSSKYILCFIYLVYVIQCTLICTLRANQNISLWTHQVYINLGDKNSPFFQSMTCLSIQLALYNQWQQKSVKRYMHIFIRSNCYATKRALNARSIKISRFRFSWKLKFEITN